MANTFKNARLALGTAVGTAYTCGTAATAVVILCQVANVDGSANVDVDVYWTDVSGTTDTYLAKTVTVPADASLGVLSGKLVLEGGDMIKGLASEASDAELSLSVLEIT